MDPPQPRARGICTHRTDVRHATRLVLYLCLPPEKNQHALCEIINTVFLILVTSHD